MGFFIGTGANLSNIFLYSILLVNVSPAAFISSYSLVFGLLIASILAFSNANSSAQLANLYPETGGTYLYARKVLGSKASLLAGVAFVIGKIISSIAIALTFGNYLFPSSHRLVGIALVVVVGIVSYFGATKTASVSKWFVYSVLGILLFYIFSVVSSENFSFVIPITDGLTIESLLLSSSINSELFNSSQGSF